jgi:hypothetical protein
MTLDRRMFCFISAATIKQLLEILFKRDKATIDIKKKKEEVSMDNMKEIIQS